jgi:hypothetical protein
VNLTSGAQFTTVQSFGGAATSVEWVVEAPTDGSTGLGDPLARYAPAVPFTGLGLAGRQASLVRVLLSQDGRHVATPSALTPAGFAVAYGASRPRPPS